MFFRDIPPFLALILSYQQDTFVGNWASSRGARQCFSGHTRVLLLSRRAANRGRAFADSTDGIGGAYAREFAAIGTALRKRYGSRVRRSRLFGQLPGRNKLKIGIRLLVSPLPEIKFILSCCGVL